MQVFFVLTDLREKLELWRQDYGSHHWTVLADPEGNEFCVGVFNPNVMAGP